MICDICPRGCAVNRSRGEVGVCGATSELEVAHCQLHFWEEPPISGDTGSGTIFFRHCNLGCIYCQNYKISRQNECMSEDHVARVSTNLDSIVPNSSSFVEDALSLQALKAMNINLVSPTHYAPWVREAVLKAKGSGLDLPIVWNTSGYESRSQIEANSGIVDVYLTDMKYSDPKLGLVLSGVSDYPERAIEAIDAMVGHTKPLAHDEFMGAPRMTSGVIVRHMLIPGHVDDSMDVMRLLFDRYGNSVKYSLMNQYTPVLATRASTGDTSALSLLKRHPELGDKVSDEDYERLLDYADSIGIRDYFWQTGEAASESFIPDF